MEHAILGAGTEHRRRNDAHLRRLEESRDPRPVRRTAFTTGVKGAGAPEPWMRHGAIR